MKIIGAGFGRTGTLSLKGALQRLGFGPCFHMVEVFAHPERAAGFRAAAAGEPIDYDELFAGYQATVDWPACYFWRELVERYPDAKVLLTVRDPRRWYTSVQNTLLRSAEEARQAPPGAVPAQLASALAMGRDIIWERQFGGRITDPEHAIRVFTEHNDAVRRAVPADRLLVFEVAQGWQPLCEFLQVPVPDEPFPRVNDSTDFRERTLARVRDAQSAG